MDELPELRSDEEVDALLARLRATIAPPAPQAQSHTATEPTSDALSSFLSVQTEATTTIARALKLLAEEVEDVALEAGPKTQGSGLSSKASSGARAVRPGASRSRRARR